MSDNDEGNKGGEGQVWTDTLPDGFADAPFIKAAGTPEEALTAINNAASHMGNSLRFPGEDASDEARAEFYSKVQEKAPDLIQRPQGEDLSTFWNSMGRPENSDGYSVPLEEGQEVPEDFGGFSEVAHELGLTQDQFGGIMKSVLAQQKQDLESMEFTQHEEMEALNTEWGVAYKQNLGQVKSFLDLMDAPDGLKELLSEGAMSTAEIKWLHNLSGSMKSPTELANQDKGANQGMVTPAEAEEKIKEMQNNKDHPYWNAADSRHKEAIKKMHTLQLAKMGQSAA